MRDQTSRLPPPDFASLNPGYALLFEVDAAASALCPAYFPVR